MKKSMGCLLVLASLGLGGGYVYAAGPGQGAPEANDQQAMDEIVSFDEVEKMLSRVPNYDWSDIREKIGNKQRVNLYKFFLSLKKPEEVYVMAYALLKDPLRRNFLTKFPPDALMSRLKWLVNYQPRNPSENVMIHQAEIIGALALYSGQYRPEYFGKYNFTGKEIRRVKAIMADGVARKRRAENDYKFGTFDAEALNYEFDTSALSFWAQDREDVLLLWKNALRMGEGKRVLHIMDMPPQFIEGFAKGPIGTVMNMHAMSAVMGMKSAESLRVEEKKALLYMFAAQADTTGGLKLWGDISINDSFKMIEVVAKAQQLLTLKGIPIDTGAALARTLLQVHVTDNKELEKYVSPSTAELISKTIKETRSKDPKGEIAVAIFNSTASPKAKEKMFDKVKKAEVSEKGKSALKSIMKDTPETKKVLEALGKLPEYSEKKKLEDAVLETDDKLRDHPKKHEGSTELDRAIEVNEVDKATVSPLPSEKRSKSQEVDRKK